MNILVVTAHHDDLELGCGGTIAKLWQEGHSIVSLVMTHSGYMGPDGTVIRDTAAALIEAKAAAAILGYELVCYEEDTLDLEVNDANITKILGVIKDYDIDTVFTHWHGDTHPPHHRVHAMVMHACRRVQRVLGFAVNWYIGAQAFSPNFFVAIDENQWQRKMKALECYESEYRRAGADWTAYLDHQSLNYGMQICTPRAEGFLVYKYLI